MKKKLIFNTFRALTLPPCNPYGSNGRRCPTKGRAPSSGARPQNAYVDKNRMSNSRQNFRPQLSQFEMQRNSPTVTDMKKLICSNFDIDQS